MDFQGLWNTMFFLKGLFYVLKVQGARIGLEINVKKKKSLRLGINEGEEVNNNF